MAAISPNAKQKAVEALLSTGFRWIEGYLNTITIRKPVSPPEEKKGCQTCMIHQHVVLARGYVEGTYARVNKDGTVPAGLGGTLAQAREHLKEAMMEIPQVMGAHPMIDTACKQLAESLPDITARLEHVSTIEEWEIVVARLKMAENTAYAIPEAIYRREWEQPEPEEQAVVLLSATDKEVLSVVSAAKRGELSPEEAKTKLNQMLSGETS